MHEQLDCCFAALHSLGDNPGTRHGQSKAPASRGGRPTVTVRHPLRARGPPSVACLDEAAHAATTGGPLCRRQVRGLPTPE
eukprot:2266974-Pleurochrysis_carterae.AAC.2